MISRLAYLIAQAKENIRRTFNSLHIIWNKNKLQVAKNRKIKVYENQNAQRYEAKATEKMCNK